MKYEDTVMDRFRIEKITKHVLADAPNAGELHINYEIAKAQAEISFERGELAGVKKVVDWIVSESVNLQAYSHPVVCVGAGDWIAKLKEWGV